MLHPAVEWLNAYNDYDSLTSRHKVTVLSLMDYLIEVLSKRIHKIPDADKVAMKAMSTYA